MSERNRTIKQISIALLDSTIGRLTANSIKDDIRIIEEIKFFIDYDILYATLTKTSQLKNLICPQKSMEANRTYTCT